MLPEIWGRTAWNFIHIVTLGYPDDPSEQDKINYYNFFQDLQYVLPCAKCRQNLAEHMQKNPITDETLSNRANLVKWGIDMHNIVNYYTGKPILSYPEAMQQIDKNIENKNSFNDNYLGIIIVIITIIIIGCLIYYLSKKN